MGWVHLSHPTSVEISLVRLSRRCPGIQITCRTGPDLSKWHVLFPIFYGELLEEDLGSVVHRKLSSSNWPLTQSMRCSCPACPR